jgi:hypothetical protein
VYLSIDSRNLVIYIEPASKVYAVDLSHLAIALRQGDENALALKSFLETGSTIKVFFDARMAARTLYRSCDIKLATEVRLYCHSRLLSFVINWNSQLCKKGTFIHEVQMMEVALRKNDPGRRWLASFDMCLTRDSGLDVDDIPFENVAFDSRILHLPVLWKKYHKQLTKVGMSFWVATIREATQKRLEEARSDNQEAHTSARSGWDKEFIEEQSEMWNEDVLMDSMHHGEWVGGAEHWAKFKVL